MNGYSVIAPPAPLATELDLSEWAALDHMPLNDDTKPRIIATMNGRYKEALNVYVKHFCGKTDVVSTQLASLDESKFTLRYCDAEAQMEEASVNYTNQAKDTIRASKAGDVRRILLDMARIASAATGDELELPQAESFNMIESDKVPGTFLLNDLISTLECLNQDEDHPVTNAVVTSHEGVEVEAGASLRSDPDVDHQLLIKLGFRQPVKLKAISFRGQTEDESAPQVVKIFQGHTSIGFQEAEEQEAVQTLELTESQISNGDPIMLRFVKFQSVTSLQLFVQSNYGADTTHIERLEFFGTPTEAVDMKAWKAVKGSVSNPIMPYIESEKADPM